MARTGPPKPVRVPAGPNEVESALAPTSRESNEMMRENILRQTTEFNVGKM